MTESTFIFTPGCYGVTVKGRVYGPLVYNQHVDSDFITNGKKFWWRGGNYEISDANKPDLIANVVPDADGWFPCDGRRPVKDKVRVDIRTEPGREWYASMAGNVKWHKVTYWRHHKPDALTELHEDGGHEAAPTVVHVDAALWDEIVKTLRWIASSPCIHPANIYNQAVSTVAKLEDVK